MSSRRKFLKSAAVVGGLSMLPESINAIPMIENLNFPQPTDPEKSIIGSYGPWADSLVKKPPKLSYRNKNFKNVDTWRDEALNTARDLISSPDIGDAPKVSVNKKYKYDGLEIEELSWQLPYGRKTEALLLKPQNSKGPMPAVLGLHDHGGNKYFGKRKITRTSDKLHPIMAEHQEFYYSDRGWANEIAKRGYVVLVHDTFTVASRRVLFEEMAEIPWGHHSTRGMSDKNPEEEENINKYNTWAAEHEHIMAKSLFCAGTTWPGVFFAEDQIALEVLMTQKEVDEKRVGCAGLSGGGLRTVYLGGLDHRVKCAIAVGFMSTWSDFLLNRAFTHTWMTYAPVLPKYLDFPEILGLRVPLPTMTLNNNEDGLYTLPEMKKADKILQDIFTKAGHGDHYKGGFYPGDHKFDAEMQNDAFDWFDRWLK